MLADLRVVRGSQNMAFCIVIAPSPIGAAIVEFGVGQSLAARHVVNGRLARVDPSVIADPRAGEPGRHRRSLLTAPLCSYRVKRCSSRSRRWEAGVGVEQVDERGPVGQDAPPVLRQLRNRAQGVTT